MAFLQRARRMLADTAPAPLDHSLLLTALAGRVGIPTRSHEAAVDEPLVELLTAGADWQRAARVQGGCFNRAEAGRDRNAP